MQKKIQTDVPTKSADYLCRSQMKTGVKQLLSYYVNNLDHYEEITKYYELWGPEREGDRMSCEEKYS